MNDIKLTPQLSAFILNIKKYISHKKLSLDEFFFEIKLSNPKRITQQEFIRIVQRINQSGQPVNVTMLFTQLSKGSAVIARETFVSSFFKVFKIDRIHLQGQSLCLKPKGSTILQKPPPNPIEQQNKRIALFGFTRLKHHMGNQKQKLDKIFNDCDLNKSGAIDKTELNKLLFASGIKQFKDKNVRRQLVYHIFDQLLKKELIGKPQFFQLFQFRKEVKSNSVKRSTKTINNNSNNYNNNYNKMRRSQVKTIKYQNPEFTPNRRRIVRGNNNYYINVQTNQNVVINNINYIQPGGNYYYNPEDEDVNDYINNYLDNLPAYDPRVPDPYAYDPDPFDQIKPVKPIKPKKPTIKPIEPLYDMEDPLYDDPYNPPYNQQDDPYNQPAQDEYYEQPQIKPKKPKIKPDPYENPKKPVNIDRPKLQITNKENNVRAYPNAGKYYRLGVPTEEDKPYIQELQRLLASKKTYQDSKNPKTGGEYVPSRQIFDNQPFQLFEMSAQEMNSQRQDLKIDKFIQANDVMQGETGDCYFLCAIGSVAAQYPQALAQLFLFQVNPACYYAVKLFVDGEWKIYKTDDLFVCKRGGGLIQNARPNNNEIWVMLLEKCFAKVYGSFKAIDGGQQKEAFFALTGAPCLEYDFRQLKSEKAVRDKIFEAQNKGYLMATAGTEYLDSLSEQQREKIGLVPGHAYSLIYIKQIKGGVILVKIRNPWGNFEWKGDWSYRSQLWTPQLRNELDYNAKYQDGTFFMNWKDYYKYFGMIAICKINPINVHSSLRMVNNNRRSNYIRMSVVKEGVYDVFICQEAQRKYQNQNYRCSPARIIILREGQNGKMDYVGSACQFNSVCNTQVKLTPGNYIISAKVEWMKWEDHQCFLNAYGPQKVTFAKIDRNIAAQFKQSIFPGFVLANRKNATLGSYADSGIAGVQTETYLPGQHGVGFIRTFNKTNRAYNVRLNFNMAGIKLANQPGNTYVMNLRPGQQDILGFIIKCVEYSFSYTRSIK